MTDKSEKSKVKLLFVLAAGILIFLTVYYAFQGEVQWISDPYGSTSDDQISIQDGQEIRIEFVAEKDDLKGIEIKLQSEIREFGNEKLLFSMIDKGTNQLLADYTLSLNDVISQVGIYVPLSCPDSKGKEVTVIITGVDIVSVPSLYIGKKSSSARPSRLFVEDTEKKEYDLVFSAVYMEKQPINIQNLLKGLLYLTLLLAVFLWFVFIKKSEIGKQESGAKRTTVVGKNKERRTANSEKIIWLLCGTVFIGILSLFVYKNNLEELIEKKSSNEISALDKDIDEKLILSSDKEILEYSFVSQKRSLSDICFTGKVKNPDPKARVRVQIFDGKENICYQDMLFNVSQLFQDAASWRIPLKKVFKESKNEMVLVRISPQGFAKTEIEFSPGAAQAYSVVKVGGRIQGIIPALTVTYNNNDWVRKLFLIFTALIYGFFFLCWFLLVYMEYSFNQVYIPIMLWLGLMYLLIIPIYSIPDEYTHVDTAYSLSNQILGIKEPENMKGYDYKRKCDVETEEYLTYDAELNDYRRLYYEMFTRVEDQELVLSTVRSGSAHVNALYYFPAAIGITIGRLMSVGTIPMLLLGRFMNLLFFTLLVFLALHGLEKQKMLFCMILLLPITLQQAASYSYDCVLIAVAIIFVARCLYFSFEAESVSFFELAVLSFSFAQIAYIKGGCYSPLCLLILIIPLERKWKWKHIVSFTLTIGFFVCGFFAQGNVINLFKNYFFKNVGSVNPLSGSEMYTFGYLIHHPFKWVSLYVNTLFVHGSRLVYELFGGKMGSLFNIQMPWIYIIGFLAIIIITCSRVSEQFEIRKRLTKIIMVLSVLGITFLLFLSMLLSDTAKTINTIQGLQGRYFIPVMILPFVLLGDFLQSKISFKGRDNILSMVYCCIHVAFLFSIIMTLFPNL